MSNAKSINQNLITTVFICHGLATVVSAMMIFCSGFAALMISLMFGIDILYFGTSPENIRFSLSIILVCILLGFASYKAWRLLDEPSEVRAERFIANFLTKFSNA